MTLSRLDCLYLAKVADQAERHKGELSSLIIAEDGSKLLMRMRSLDVIVQMKDLISCAEAQLTIDERNLLSIAYKNITATLRSSWRSIDTLRRRRDAQYTPRQLVLIGREKEVIERELTDICKDITSLLEKYLIPASAGGEEKVFYCKM